MKVKITVEYDVEADHELQGKEITNVVGMLQRMTRNRVLGFQGQHLGGEHASTGWEVEVKGVTVEAVSKTK